MNHDGSPVASIVVVVALSAAPACAPTNAPASPEAGEAPSASSEPDLSAAPPSSASTAAEPGGGASDPNDPTASPAENEPSGPLPEAPAGIPVDVYADGRCVAAEPICPGTRECDAPATIAVQCPAIDWQPDFAPTLHAAAWFTADKPGGATERIDVVRSGERCVLSVLRLESRDADVRRVYRETLDVDCGAVDEVWKTAERNGLRKFKPLGRSEPRADAISHGLLLQWEEDGEMQTHEVTWRDAITNERVYARFVRKLAELATNEGSLDLQMMTPHWG